MDQLKLVPAEEEPEEPVIEVGSEVHHDGEKAICTVKSIKGDDVVIEDANSDQYDVLMEELVLAAADF